MEQHEQIIAEKANTRQDYITAADNIFNASVKSQFLTAMKGNIWRASAGFDTLIDYLNLTVVNKPITQSFANDVFNQLMAASGGDWWDDFGWAGNASVRAAQKLNIDAASKALFIQQALNCWCYMYGPGWQKNSQGKPFNVPYPDQNGWKEFIHKKGGDIGAPNVYAYWAANSATYPHYRTHEPMFSPGGVWNSTNLNNPSSLDPLQNTVTNAVFFLLSLRLLRLSQDSAYAAYFTNVSFDVSKIQTSVQNQFDWFIKWFNHQPNTPKSLLYMLNERDITSGILSRERSPLYKTGPVAGYTQDLFWTGDQGLLVAAFREAFENSPLFSTEDHAQATSMFGAFIEGVWKAAFSNTGYTSIPFPVLRPWVQYTSGIQPQYTYFPPGDDADYLTGTAVYCRSLQQSVAAGHVPPPDLKAKITQLADLIVAGNRFKQHNYVCEAFSPDNPDFSSGANSMTPYINQLAVLCVAAQMNP